MEIEKNRPESEYCLGMDVGGTHISAAFINKQDCTVLDNKIFNLKINSKDTASVILSEWSNLVESLVREIPERSLIGIGVAIPGPFDYQRGISKISGLDKFESIFGADIYQIIRRALPDDEIPIVFTNDATGFALGKYHAGAAKDSARSIVVTLGSGFGSTFLVDGTPQTVEKRGVPRDGFLYHCPMGESIADDYFSTRWFLKMWNGQRDEKIKGVDELVSFADKGDKTAIEIFNSFADNLAGFMASWFSSFDPDTFVLGGNISRASAFFLQRFIDNLSALGVGKVKVKCAGLLDEASIIGAAMYAATTGAAGKADRPLRNTTQYLMPEKSYPTDAGNYDIYPGFSIGNGKIKSGYSALAQWMCGHKNVMIDGYVGVFWDEFIDGVDREFRKMGKTVLWLHTTAAMHDPAYIDSMIEPYLGGDDPIFGYVTDKELSDWFDKEKLSLIKPDDGFDVTILVGPGAGLCKWNAPLVYVDVPKNEIQFRMRAGSITNLGSNKVQDVRLMYKRFFFVDWMALNRHKNHILPDIDLIVDGQRTNNCLFMEGNDLREGLDTMAHNFFRVRPWFEPGVWGGTWMKERFSGINPECDNLAWSFELMSYENGLLFESDHYLFEVSFDFLMYNNHKEILGDCAERFGYDFPIRFDFLDTFDGGNLSVQCHPHPEYIREKFGMPFTQDETYYIMDCKPDAVVYLGFRDDIVPEQFHKALIESQEEAKEIEVADFVQKWPAVKHGLYLIPNGTIHASGINNLVLEISSAPYIFTFKMYDWMRLDLDGRPRPINIDHGMENLCFERKGAKVEQELISHPHVISQGQGVTIEHLPTHKDHFYDVYRYTFNENIDINTSGKVHVCMLVGGSSITLRTKEGREQIFNYAETFIVPAVAESYTIRNNGSDRAVLIQSFVK
jgi:predicted NBD/HSP70 family sugar kinase/mannose-6-phosphate isomerase class I